MTEKNNLTQELNIPAGYVLLRQEDVNQESCAREQMLEESETGPLRVGDQLVAVLFLSLLSVLLYMTGSLNGLSENLLGFVSQPVETARTEIVPEQQIVVLPNGDPQPPQQVVAQPPQRVVAQPPQRVVVQPPQQVVAQPPQQVVTILPNGDAPPSDQVTILPNGDTPEASPVTEIISETDTISETEVVSGTEMVSATEVISATEVPLVTMIPNATSTEVPQVVYVTATPVTSSDCTSSMLGIPCGTASTPVPTMLPINGTNGVGGPVPLGPTPEAHEVKPHDEVVPPNEELFIIKGVHEWGDVTVRSVFDGQQGGYNCYTSKYSDDPYMNDEMVCPPPEILANWKQTHVVEYIVGEEAILTASQQLPRTQQAPPSLSWDTSPVRAAPLPDVVVTATPVPTLPPIIVTATMIPVTSDSGIGGAAPALSPTPTIHVVAPAEVVVAESQYFIIQGVKGWGDVTVRTGWNGQEASYICYSSNYNGERFTCLTQMVDEWKSTYPVVNTEF